MRSSGEIVTLVRPMNKRPGEVRVTTEVAYCTFCGRPRTLRSEERQLGTLVRTVITCETCHRTLSSLVGVASPDAPTAEPAVPDPVAAASTLAPAVTPAPAPKPTPAKAPAPAKKPAIPAKRSATKPAPKAKAKPKAPAGKKKVPPKPRGKGSK